MRLLVIRFLLVLACGILLGHNLIPHHHHPDKVEVYVTHEEDDHGHHHHFTHNIDDAYWLKIFDFKLLPSDSYASVLDVPLCFEIINPVGLQHFKWIQLKEHPPSCAYLHAFFLRGPPSLS